MPTFRSLTVAELSTLLCALRALQLHAADDYKRTSKMADEAEDGRARAAVRRVADSYAATATECVTLAELIEDADAVQLVNPTT